MSELAVLMVRQYINENLFAPVITWPKNFFDERSYSRWAAYEIIKLIQAEPNIPVNILIQKFVYKLDNYSCMADWRKDVSYMFLTAKDTAEDIGCMFI